MKERFFYNLLVVSAILWCMLLLSPSLMQMADPTYSPLANGIYKSFSSICHQYDSHSLHLGGYKLAVCGRCTAIYFGFLAGVILFRFFARKRLSHLLVLWIVAVAPMSIDVALDVLGGHSSTLLTRLVTGGWFGAIAGVILTPLFVEASMQVFHQKSQGVAYESET